MTTTTVRPLHLVNRLATYLQPTFFLCIPISCDRIWSLRSSFRMRWLFTTKILSSSLILSSSIEWKFRCFEKWWFLLDNFRQIFTRRLILFEHFFSSIQIEFVKTVGIEPWWKVDGLMISGAIVWLIAARILIFL